MAAERVERLKGLVDALERLPESEDRDRLLREVRSRAVDLDTGVTPRAMLPMHEPTLAPVFPKLPKRHSPSSVTITAQPERAPAVELRLPASAANLSSDATHAPWASDRLSLEDSPGFPPLPNGDPSVRPWTLGLRG